VLFVSVEGAHIAGYALPIRRAYCRVWALSSGFLGGTKGTLIVLFVRACERFPLIRCGRIRELLCQDMGLAFNQCTGKAMCSVHDCAVCVEDDRVFKVHSKDPFNSAGDVSDCRFMAIPEPSVEVAPREGVDPDQSALHLSGEFPQAIDVPSSPEAICLDRVPLSLGLHIFWDDNGYARE
jgi:hypothetical protein